MLHIVYSVQRRYFPCRRKIKDRRLINSILWQMPGTAQPARRCDLLRLYRSMNRIDRDDVMVAVIVIAADPSSMHCAYSGWRDCQCRITSPRCSRKHLLSRQ